MFSVVPSLALTISGHGSLSYSTSGPPRDLDLCCPSLCVHLPEIRAFSKGECWTWAGCPALNTCHAASHLALPLHPCDNGSRCPTLHGLLGPPGQSTAGWWLQQQEAIFVPVLEAGRPKSRCWRGWLLLWPLSLACRCPPSCCVPVGPLCVHVRPVSLSEQMPLFPMQSHWSGPTQTASF